MTLSIEEARKVALFAQLHNLQKLSGKNGVYELIRQLGYVQIDTISVVERAHHHTIWSRIPDYDKPWLDELLSRDRLIYEHWGHAASYLPMEDYRFSLPRMQLFPDTSGWERQFFDNCKHVLQDVLARIKAEGPLGAKDFPNKQDVKTYFVWGSVKPEKIALELLLWKGELMIDRRDKFQRIYDLRERILPDWVNTNFPSDEELYRHYILRSLSSLGIGSESDIRGHFMLKQSTEFSKQFSNLLDAGEMQKLTVKGLQEDYYALPDTLTAEQTTESEIPKMHILSPFDNLVIQLPRLIKLFGFDYTLECYVTPSKRVYGYWCLPLLYGQDFVGRLDCKANRSSKKMELIKLFWEDGIKPNKAMKQALQRTFDQFAQFCGCESVSIS